MSPSLDQLVQKGNEYQDDGDHYRALECYEQARQQYPQLARPLKKWEETILTEYRLRVAAQL